MYVSGKTLLQLMSSPLAQNKFASLNLFSLLHATKNLSSVVALSTDTADHILQTIYLDFQMMTLKVLCFKMSLIVEGAKHYQNEIIFRCLLLLKKNLCCGSRKKHKNIIINYRGAVGATLKAFSHQTSVT